MYRFSSVDVRERRWGTKGLGWVSGKAKIQSSKNYKVPHVGWSRVTKKQTLLLKDLDDSEFYFLHSYSSKINNVKYVRATFNYGCEMTAVVENNIFGVQFHPEKVRKGLKVLQNFNTI